MSRHKKLNTRRYFPIACSVNTVDSGSSTTYSNENTSHPFSSAPACGIMRTLSLSSTSEESNCALDARIADSNVPVSLYALTVDAGSARSGPTRSIR